MLRIFILLLSIASGIQNAEAQGQLIPYRKGNLWGYADTNGKIVVEPIYNEVEHLFGKRFACVQQNAQWGLIDNAGKVRIKPQFYKLFSLGHDLFGITDRGGFYFICDSTGKNILNDTLYYVREFVGNLAVATSKNHKQGVIDHEGKNILPFQYDEIEICRNGYIRTVLKDFRQDSHPSVHYFRADGTILTERSFAGGKCFEHSVALVEIANGKKYKPLFEYVENGERVTGERVTGEGKKRRATRTNMIDLNGKVLLPEKTDLDDAGFKFGPGIITDGKKYGLCDTTGKLILPMEYGYIINNYYQGNFTVADCSLDEYYDKEKPALNGVYISSTNTLVPPQFDKSVRQFKNGWATVEKEGKFNFMDEYGKFILPEYVEDAWMDETGAIIYKNNHWYWLDGKGEIILKDISERYSQIRSFYKGVAVVRKGENLYGCVDTTGTEILSCRFKSVTHNWHYHHLLAIEKEGSYPATLFTYQGDPILDESYEAIDDVYPFCDLKYWQKDGRKVFTDTLGHELFELNCTQVWYAGGQLIIYKTIDVKEPAVWGIANLKGTVLMEPKEVWFPEMKFGYIYFGRNTGYASKDGKLFWEEE